MKIKEYVETAKQIEPLLEPLNEARGIMLLREVFHQIAYEINETDNGAVAVPGLGRFIVQRIEREEKGQKVVTHRIVFKSVPKGPEVKA